MAIENDGAGCCATWAQARRGRIAKFEARTRELVEGTFDLIEIVEPFLTHAGSCGSTLRPPATKASDDRVG